MLPMTRRRRTTLPHRIALLAAAICLMLAFTVDQTTVEDSASSRTGLSVMADSEDDQMTTPVSARERAAASTRQSRSSALSLSPWFSGLSY